MVCLISRRQRVSGSQRSRPDARFHRRSPRILERPARGSYSRIAPAPRRDRSHPRKIWSQCYESLTAIGIFDPKEIPPSSSTWLFDLEKLRRPPSSSRRKRHRGEILSLIPRPASFQSAHRTVLHHLASASTCLLLRAARVGVDGDYLDPVARLTAQDEIILCKTASSEWSSTATG